MKVLILEDEAPAARRLIKLIGQCDPAIEIAEVVESVRYGRQWLSENEHPALIFLTHNALIH